MNMLFNPAWLENLWIRRLIILAFTASSLALAASIGRLFLPGESVEKQVHVPFNYFRPYPLDRAFGITNAPVSSAPAAATINLLTALKIKGIYAEGKGEGFVVVEEGKSILFLSRGESFKGYTLDRVESKRAVFMKDGQPYELRLEEKTPAARVVSAPAAKNAPKADTAQSLREIPRNELERYRQDARLIWDNIGINPVTENGQFKEFRITFVARGSVFEQLGLQAGDVLKAANGIELDGYAAALRLYSEIDKIEAFRLTILRNNQIRELDYEIR